MFRIVLGAFLCVLALALIILGIGPSLILKWGEPMMVIVGFIGLIASFVLLLSGIADRIQRNAIESLKRVIGKPRGAALVLLTDFAEGRLELQELFNGWPKSDDQLLAVIVKAIAIQDKPKARENVARMGIHAILKEWEAVQFIESARRSTF